MGKNLLNTWGRSVLNGHLLLDTEEYGLIIKTYIKGMLDALDVAYMINRHSDGFVDIRVECSDTLYEVIMTKIDKFRLKD